MCCNVLLCILLITTILKAQNTSETNPSFVLNRGRFTHSPRRLLCSTTCAVMLFCCAVVLLCCAVVLLCCALVLCCCAVVLIQGRLSSLVGAQSNPDGGGSYLAAAAAIQPRQDSYQISIHRYPYRSSALVAIAIAKI